jgi:hypothetical protein
LIDSFSQFFCIALIKDTILNSNGKIEQQRDKFKYLTYKFQSMMTDKKTFFIIRLNYFIWIVEIVMKDATTTTVFLNFVRKFHLTLITVIEIIFTNEQVLFD